MSLIFNSKKTLLLMLIGLFLGLSFSYGCGIKERLFSSDHSTAASGSPATAGGAGGGGSAAEPNRLQVNGSLASGGVAPAETGLISDYFSLWVGSFLDLAPAQKVVSTFQREGLASFTVKKTLVEKSIVGGKTIGDYHLVMVGLFGEHKDAENLGKLLQAQAKITNWQVIPSDNPGEMGQANLQTQTMVQTSEKVTQAAQEKAGKPLSPNSPVVTGEAFKNMVRGRFVGSFRDSQAARKEAERLTASGWPASVVSEPASGGMWYRVILAQPSDNRDFKAPPAEIERARASAAGQEGLVFLIDTSGAKGIWGRKESAADRRDASACAGFSRAGRLRTCVERLIGYIPEVGLLVAVKPISFKEADNIVDKVVRPVKSLFTGDDSEYTEAKSAYGPTVYNRPDMMSRVKNLTVAPDSVPISPALDALTELAAIPGRKTVILYSEFGLSSDADQAIAALGRLKGQYGNSLRFFVVYGDTDDLGWRQAENMAKTAGSGQAWNGCQLLYDNAYFEKFVKTIFSR
ncbi:MAG: hypothetical protein LBS44_00730 [Deltaproteobacteria bacterium]|nr:hypothetical protein [Deltaproteobacteria bacterium]